MGRVGLTAAVVGGAGYIGGELLRLVLGHPELRLVQATSDSQAGRPVPSVHPNLRHLTSMQFTAHDAVEPADVIFLALPHGEVLPRLAALAAKARIVVDLSADFRLRDPAAHARWYGATHPDPELGERFVPGLPEIGRASCRERV